MKSPAKNLLIAAATLVAATSAFANIAVKTATGTTELADGSAGVWTGGLGSNGAPAATGDTVSWDINSLVGAQTISSDVSWNKMYFGSPTNDTGTGTGLSGALTTGGTGTITLSGTSAGIGNLLNNGVNFGAYNTNTALSGTTPAVTIGNNIIVTASSGGSSAGTSTGRLQFIGDAGALILTGSVTATGTGTTSDGDVNLWIRGRSTDSRIDGTITVDGQLAKGDTGTWTLSGTNTIGKVYIGSGALLAGSDQAFGTGTIYLANNNNGNNIALASKDTANRAYANGLDFAIGATNFTGPTWSVIFGQTTGGTGTQSFSGGVNLGTAVRNITTNTDTTFSGIVTGTLGGITKLGTAKLILKAANTYTGATNITAGTIALSNGNNRLATTGTVNFTGAGTLDVGSTSQSLANLTVADGFTGTVTGTGSLTLTGSAFTVGSANGNQAVDLSGLSNFAYNNATGTMSIGGTATGSAVGRSASVTLAGSNTITAATVWAGSSSGGNTNTTRNSGTVLLGQTNVINADTLNIGGNDTDGTLKFRTGLTSGPTLQIRNAAGTGRANVVVAQCASSPGDISAVDLVTGVTGTSQLDAQIGTLTIGLRNRGSAQTSNHVTTGSFTMGGGTLDATNIIIAQQVANDKADNGFTGALTGTFTTGSGTVKVGTLTLGDELNTSITSNNSVSANFNLNGGGVLAAQTIQPGATGGSVVMTRTFTWNDGTIKNYDASTDLTISAGLNTFAVTGAGTHAFDISAGRTGTVNQAMSGSGALTKVGAGSLILKANNSGFSGGISVNAGTLVTGHASSLGSGSVNIAAGTLQVGDGTTNAVTLGSAANLAVADGAFIKLGALNNASLDASVGVNGVIALSGGGKYDFNGSGKLDLNGILNGTSGGTHTYNLITGSGVVTNELKLANITGYDSNLISLTSFANGRLVFTAVPEPSTYGLIGAGALAGVALVRRRRKFAGKAA